MSFLKLERSEQFYRVEVASHLWFFMNHERRHRDHVAHDHNFIELAFILKGSARHITVAGEGRCCAKEVYVIPRGAWHAYANCCELEVVNCLLSPQMLSKELAWLLEDPVLGLLLGLRNHGAHQGITKIDFEAAVFKQLVSQLKALERAYAPEVSRVKLLSYLLPVLNTVREAALVGMKSSINIEEAHPTVRRALSLLHGQMSRDWTLESLAAELQLNPSYFVRLFRGHVGKPPMKYLACVRAEAAANQLISSRLRVGEIGVSVGWPDPKLFARKFRQHFGMRATEYRQQIFGNGMQIFD